MRAPAMDGPRESTRFLTGLMIVMILIAFGGVGAQGFALWLTWQAGQPADWGDFWIHTWDATPLSLVLVGVVAIVLMMRQGQQVMAVVRRAAWMGDDTLAPPADTQPEPFPAGDLPVGPVEVGPLAAFPRGQPGLQDAAVLLLGFVGVIFGMLAVVAGISLLGGVSGNAFPVYVALFILMAAVAFAALAGAVYLALWVDRVSRGLRFVADEAGIRPIGWPMSRIGSVAWRDVRALYDRSGPRREGQRIPPGSDHLYTLDSGTKRLQWVVPTDVSPTTDEAHRLLRLAVTRTGLPLREASPRVFAIERLYTSSNTTTTRTPLPEDVANPLADALIPDFRRQWRRMAVVAGVYVGLVGALLVAGLILQHLPVR